jgi:PhnB protein
MAVRPVPEGYHTVTPYLTVRDLRKLLDYVQKAFEATSVNAMTMPDGTIRHAEFQIGDSKLMAGEASEKWEPRPGTLYLYVPNVDAVFKKAVAAGGQVIMEPTDMFYGDRNGGVTDPCGNQWWIGTRIEEVSPEEMLRRAAVHGK